MLSRVDHSLYFKEQVSLILWIQSPSAVILEPKKIKSLTVSIVSPSIYHEVMGPADFILGGSKIIADGGCSHEIKR